MTESEKALIERKLTELTKLLTAALGEDDKHSPIWKVIQEIQSGLQVTEGHAKSATVRTGRP